MSGTLSPSGAVSASGARETVTSSDGPVDGAQWNGRGVAPGNMFQQTTCFSNVSAWCRIQQHIPTWPGATPRRFLSPAGCIDTKGCRKQCQIARPQQHPANISTVDRVSHQHLTDISRPGAAKVNGRTLLPFSRQYYSITVSHQYLAIINHLASISPVSHQPGSQQDLTRIWRKLGSAPLSRISPGRVLFHQYSVFHQDLSPGSHPVFHQYLARISPGRVPHQYLTSLSPVSHGLAPPRTTAGRCSTVSQQDLTSISPVSHGLVPARSVAGHCCTVCHQDRTRISPGSHQDRTGIAPGSHQYYYLTSISPVSRQYLTSISPAVSRQYFTCTQYFTSISPVSLQHYSISPESRH